MNPSQPSHRRRREARLAPELLESRELLTAGVGDTFAILPGTIAKAGQPAAIKFTIDPAHFTIPKGKFTLGIDVTPTSGSTVKPQIVSVNNPSGANVPVTHGRYAANLPSKTVTAGAATAAVTAPVQFDHKNPNGSVTYTVNVRGLNGTKGGFLVGFYVPGDANGDGTVTQADLTAIQSEIGVNASNSKYTFDADSNRDGQITKTDHKVATKNLGVSTTINPTASSHLDPTGETMPNSRAVNVPSAHFTGTVTPGATIKYQNSASGSTAISATADSKGNYSIVVPLNPGNNTFNVTTLDAFRQSIAGSIAPVAYVPGGSSTKTS